MIFGSNLDGLPPPEHPWDLLAAAGGSPMPKSKIFDGFWLSSGFSWGAIWGPWVTLWGLIGALDGLFCFCLFDFILDRFLAAKCCQNCLKKGCPDPA